ncbi:hypothetical protein DFJ77DRAFT_480262 [Powellomyces hirtus]|nr:hypothetical protein DFJ77DRAFT_480262 [Powellomyces hirtus]
MSRSHMEKGAEPSSSNGGAGKGRRKVLFWHRSRPKPQRDFTVFRVLRIGFKMYPKTTFLIMFWFPVVLWLGCVSVPIAQAIDFDYKNLPPPPERVRTASYDYDEHLQGPGHIDWWAYTVYFFPAYFVSTLGLMAMILISFMPKAWPRGWIDFAGFALPTVLLPTGANQLARHFKPDLVTSKIWLAFLTVSVVAYGMLYALGHNALDRRRWEAQKREEQKRLLARLSVHNKASNGANGVSAWEQTPPSGTGSTLPRDSGAQTSTGTSKAANSRVLSSLPTKKRSAPLVEPMSSTSILWLFGATSVLASLFFFGQAASWFYFETSPHSFWVDIALVQGFRMLFVIWGKLGMMLVSDKIGTRHTPALEFFVDMQYWMFYRNMFTAHFSSPWTVPVFSVTHGLQRIIWTRVKFSQPYHRFLVRISSHAHGWMNKVLAPQHHLTSSASTILAEGDGLENAENGADATQAVLKELGEKQDGVDEHDVVKEYAEQMPPAKVLKTSVLDMPWVRRTGTSDLDMVDLEVRRLSGGGSDSKPPCKQQQPQKQQAQPPQPRLRDLAASRDSKMSGDGLAAPREWQYSEYVQAQFIYEANEEFAQIVTLVALLLALALVRHGPNAVCYPNFSYMLDYERCTLVVKEAVATFLAEIVAIAVGHYLVFRITGKSIWKEYVKFSGAKPRTFLLTVAMVFHILFDSSITTIHLRFHPKD